MIPEIGVHDGELIMLKVRGEDFVPIKWLRPSVANGRRGGEMFCSGITTGSGRGDERVWGRHVQQRNVRVKLKEGGEEQLMGKRNGKPTHFTSQDLTLNPKSAASEQPLSFTALPIMFQPQY